MKDWTWTDKELGRAERQTTKHAGTHRSTEAVRRASRGSKAPITDRQYDMYPVLPVRHGETNAE